MASKSTHEEEDIIFKVKYLKTTSGSKFEILRHRFFFRKAMRIKLKQREQLFLDLTLS